MSFCPNASSQLHFADEDDLQITTAPMNSRERSWKTLFPRDAVHDSTLFKDLFSVFTQAYSRKNRSSSAHADVPGSATSDKLSRQHIDLVGLHTAILCPRVLGSDLRTAIVEGLRRMLDKIADLPEYINLFAISASAVS